MSLRMCFPVGVVLLTFTMLKMTFLSSDMRMGIQVDVQGPKANAKLGRRSPFGQGQQGDFRRHAHPSRETEDTETSVDMQVLAAFQVKATPAFVGQVRKVTI